MTHGISFASLRPLAGGLVLCVAGWSPLPSAAEPLDCVIHPHVVIALGSGDAGLLEAVHVDRSDRVEAGQVVAELESEVERAAVDFARARADFDTEVRARQAALAFDERKRERTDSLYDQKAVPFTLLDEAERDAVLARYQVRRAEEERRLAALDLRRAEAQLRRRTIRSPIAGIVVERYKSPGEYVEDDPVLKIAQLHPLRVEVIVPVELFGSVRTGMRASVSTEHDLGGRHTATVTAVDRVLDAASGTFGVRLELPNPELALPAGLRCRLTFGASATEASSQSTRPPPPASASAVARVDRDPSLAGTSPAAGPVETGVSVKQTEQAGQDRPGDARPAPPRAPGVAAVAVTAERSRRQCRTLGPLADAAAAASARAALAPHVVDLDQREETRTVADGHLVVAEPATGRAGADAVVATLRAHAIDDFYVFEGGPRRGQVALGVYNRVDLARRWIRHLGSIGVQARLEQRERERRVWWLDFELAADRTGGSDLDAVAAAGPGSTVEPRRCPELLAAGR